MDRAKLYDALASRKLKPADFEYRRGTNGRVDRCADHMRLMIARGAVPLTGWLVDVGGGIGDLWCAARDLFAGCVVVDISNVNLDVARAKGSRTVCVDVDAEPTWYADVYEMIESSVSVVAALDFIEHIVDPVEFARSCFSLLAPGGVVYVNTPNVQFWRHMASLVVDGRFPHTSGDPEVYHGGHLAFYTFDDLREIFAIAGFVECEQAMDDECFEQPPEQWIRMHGRVPRTQEDHRQLMMRLGCPNLMFTCRKR